jgi:hypothetical protein
MSLLICVGCGLPLGSDTRPPSDGAREHVRMCPQHPLKDAEARRLREGIEALAERFVAIATTYDLNADEWRRRSTAEHPHALAVGERTAMADAYRACASDLRALLAGKGGET